MREPSVFLSDVAGGDFPEEYICKDIFAWTMFEQDTYDVGGKVLIHIGRCGEAYKRMMQCMGRVVII